MSARVIDLFAGAGGFSTGAQQAGARVLWAGNHWDQAVLTHALNHADVVHTQENLHQTDWTRVPGHDILLASPSCVGHSKARGKERPHHDALRATAWCVVNAVDVHRPQCVIVENVAEFLDWDCYPAWKQALELMGYHVVAQVLDAADFGVPQRRERVFITAHRAKPLHLINPQLSHRAVWDIIQWDHPKARSLANRKQPLAPRTAACIEHGRRTYGERFLVPYYGYEHRARNPHKPLGTVTTNNHFGVYSYGTYRMLSVDEIREAMSFPDSYWLPDQTMIAIKLLGNAVCPRVARDIVGQAMRSLA